MRPDQEFVWGIDLKSALKQINAHFLTLPEDVREKGVLSFADSPPVGNRVAKLWDKYMRKDYREDSEIEMTPEQQAELVKRFKTFRKQNTIDLDDLEKGEDEMISVSRMVRRKRGSWWQVPKDLPDPKDDDDD
jgi:hypothetical protein